MHYSDLLLSIIVVPLILIVMLIKIMKSVINRKFTSFTFILSVVVAYFTWPIVEVLKCPPNYGFQKGFQLISFNLSLPGMIYEGCKDVVKSSIFMEIYSKKGLNETEFYIYTFILNIIFIFAVLYMLFSIFYYIKRKLLKR